MNDKQTIGFIGFGNMASAIGLSIRDNSHYSLIVSEPDSAKHTYENITFTDAADVFNHAEIIFLGFKPQQCELISNELAPFVKPHHTLISMLAGIEIATLKSMFNSTQIVRIMPNAPALTGCGVTGICFSSDISKSNQSLILGVCSLFGKNISLDDETQMHTITALSGSGPAFFYKIVNAFSDFAEENGLDSKTALIAAIYTMCGAGEMLKNNPNPKQLIDMVRSPNGTTHAGLLKMDDLHIDASLKSVLESAFQRSIELSKGVK